MRVPHDIITHERWRNVVVNGKVPVDKFNWTPPEGWQEFRLANFEDGLLKPDTEAPDFNLLSADGRSIELSDFRGKWVWLVFWRVGCQPCRDGIPTLETLYQKYRDRGLVVLGFNCADDRQIALNLLQEHAVTFPCVLDSSDEASRIYFECYQTLRGMSGVPLNYIIDAQGWITDSWYGDYDEAHVRQAMKLE